MRKEVIPMVAHAEESLAELAHAINQDHDAGEAATRAGLEHYRRAGERLLKAKAKCGHGKWLAWLKANVRFGERQARRYITLAKSDVTSDLAEQWRIILGNTHDDTGEAEEEEQDSPAAEGGEGGAGWEGDYRLEPYPHWPDRTEDDAQSSAPEQDLFALPTVGATETFKPGEYITLSDWSSMTKIQRKEVLAITASDKKFNSQGDNENIEWALWSWNPVTGCEHNCPYCYARDIANRFYPSKFEPTLWPSRLLAPQNTPFPEEKASQWMGHKNVFTCSMADLFGRWVPREWIDAVLEAVRSAPQWNFLFLTKFPQRMAEFTFPDNAWVGTSVDCQARVANAERAFRKIKAGVKWLSCEPLIEPLTFSDLGAFDWIVLGGASRSSQTPEWVPPKRWILDIEEEAARLGVRVYEKTNLRTRQYPGGEWAGMPGVTIDVAPEQLRYLPEVK